MADEWANLEKYAFGDTPEMADALGALVVKGIKRATCWRYADTEDSDDFVGKRAVILDGKGRPLCVVETVEIRKTTFGEVDAAFAFEEGEGDRTLENWRREHRAFFEKNGEWREDMPLVCERFKLVTGQHCS